RAGAGAEKPLRPAHAGAGEGGRGDDLRHREQDAPPAHRQAPGGPARRERPGRRRGRAVRPRRDGTQGGRRLRPDRRAQPPLRIATRKSPLALWQARHVAGLLRARSPALEVSLVELTTEGDRMLDAPLSRIGGKGLFVKEIEAALLDGRADLAVHSLKDVTSFFPPG